MEKIVAAAIKLSTGVVCHVPAPWGHADVMHGLYNHVAKCYLIKRLGPLIGEDCEQGFLTDSGRFVDRTEGLVIAKETSQIVKKHPCYDQLYSEDIWCKDRSILYEQMKEIGGYEGYHSYFQFWRNINDKR